jgi:hypothetical protein
VCNILFSLYRPSKSDGIIRSLFHWCHCGRQSFECNIDSNRLFQQSTLSCAAVNIELFNQCSFETVFINIDEQSNNQCYQSSCRQIDEKNFTGKAFERLVYVCRSSCHDQHRRQSKIYNRNKHLAFV